MQIEGSFEAGDKESKIIVRHSKSKLEEMIFEVFWEPRRDGTQLKSKLVKYQELKNFSPVSLIYWLEIMVKNSLKEIESDHAKLKELEDKKNAESVSIMKFLKIEEENAFKN